MAKIPKVTPKAVEEGAALLESLLGQARGASVAAVERTTPKSVSSIFERLLGGEKDVKAAVKGGVSAPATTSGKGVSSKVSGSRDYVPSGRVKVSPKLAPEVQKISSKLRGKVETHTLTEREKEKGILTLENAARSVRAILESGERKFLDIAGLIPVVGTATGLAEIIGGMPDSDAIIAVMRELVMSQSNKRQREKLAARTAGARGPKARATYVLRRKDGTGWDGKTSAGRPPAQKPAPAPAPPAQIVPASPPGGPAQAAQKNAIDEMQKAALAKLKK